MELLVDLFVQRLELGVHLLHGQLGVVELHRGDLVDQVGHRRLDVRPGDLRVRGRVLDGLHAAVVEVRDHTQHAHRLVQRRGEVVVGVRVLLQEVFTDVLRHLHPHLEWMEMGRATLQHTIL